MEHESGGAGFLTVAVVVIALVLPGLVLLEMWRSRRVALADDAPDTVLDPVLSGAGMSRKILLMMVVLIEAMLLFLAYGANEPFRQASARERQKEFAIEAGAHTYVQYCVSCHGVSGKGYLENIGLVGKPVNTSALQATDPDERKAKIKADAEALAKALGLSRNDGGGQCVNRVGALHIAFGFINRRIGCGIHNHIGHMLADAAGQTL